MTILKLLFLLFVILTSGTSVYGSSGLKCSTVFTQDYPVDSAFAERLRSLQGEGYVLSQKEAAEKAGKIGFEAIIEMINEHDPIKKENMAKVADVALRVGQELAPNEASNFWNFSILLFLQGDVSKIASFVQSMQKMSKDSNQIEVRLWANAVMRMSAVHVFLYQGKVVEAANEWWRLVRSGVTRREGYIFYRYSSWPPGFIQRIIGDNVPENSDVETFTRFLINPYSPYENVTALGHRNQLVEGESKDVWRMPFGEFYSF